MSINEIIKIFEYYSSSDAQNRYEQEQDNKHDEYINQIKQEVIKKIQDPLLNENKLMQIFNLLKC